MQTREQLRAEKAAMTAQWQQSGLTQKQYCEQNNIAYATFQYWLRRSRSNQPSPLPSFIKLDAPPGCVYAELIVPNGKRLVFHQPVTAALLNALL
jgi:hypothetical protein